MQIVIIGGGPAGRTSAIELAKLGENVTLIEAKHVGGTCLNEGCMMINGLSEIARFIEDSENYNKLGILNIKYNFEYEPIAAGIKKTLNIFRSINENEILENNVNLIYGEATIVDDKVKINDEIIEYDKLLISTGAKPKYPPIKGIHSALTYKDILSMKKLPEKLIIIGSGIMATEFSWIFSSMGSEVKMLCRSNFLNILNKKHSNYIKNHLLKKVEIIENVNINEIHENKITTNKGEFEGVILLATGTKPNSEIIEGIVELGDNGEILVNNHMQTSKKNIYAAGDVIGGIGGTPIARMEGIVAGHNMIGIEEEVDYDYIHKTISLNYDVSFFDSDFDCDGEDDFSISVPNSAGTGSFWRVIAGETGFTDLNVNLYSGKINGLISVGPSARYVFSYLSMFLRLNHDIYDYDKFIEAHPSTDTVYRLMRLLK